MTSILMVCLGNICRSPLAHGILESKLPSDQFYVDSAGTANYHVGDAPDDRSIDVAKSNGIDIQTNMVDNSRYQILTHSITYIRWITLTIKMS